MTKRTEWGGGVGLALFCCLTGSLASPPVVGQTRNTPSAAPAPAAQAPAPAPAPASTPAAARSQGADGSQIIARVGDKDVTAAELRATIQTLDARQQAALAGDPALLAQTVRSILATQLVLKEALAKKWDQQPTVQTQLARLRDNVVTESYLQSVTSPPDAFPSEAELTAFFNANASALVLPRRFRLAQIVVPLARDADKAAQDAAQRKLDDVVKKLKQPGADFAAIAKASQDDNAQGDKGTEIGWVFEPDLRVELRGAVAGLQKAGTSEPIRLEDGWHIIKLIDTEASRPRTLDEVKEGLVQRLRAERSEANRRAYIQDLLKQSPPVLNELALSQLLSKTDGSK